MNTPKNTFKTLIAAVIFLIAITANVNAQETNRSIDFARTDTTITPEFSPSGIWYSSQADITKIVLTDNNVGTLLCKWYFRNGHENKFILKKIISPNGKNAKAIEKSIDIQATENETNGVYEYTYGENDRYIGTLFIINEKIIEIDEDTQTPDYYAMYEWYK